MLIRPGSCDDITAVLKLIRSVVPLMRAAGNLQWDESYPNRDVFAGDVDTGQLWIADFDGIVGGVAAITTDQEPEYREVGWDITEPAIVVHRLAVAPEFRGRGVAAALMKQAERVARDRNIDVLRVDTNDQNLATQRLFRRLSYTFSGEIELRFRPGLRFLCYEKRLSGEHRRAQATRL